MIDQGSQMPQIKDKLNKSIVLESSKFIDKLFSTDQASRDTDDTNSFTDVQRSSTLFTIQTRKIEVDGSFQHLNSF